MNGYLHTLVDPHTQIFPREFIEKMKSLNHKEYIGIGIGSN